MKYRARERRSEWNGKLYWQVEQLMGPRFIEVFSHTDDGREQAKRLADKWNDEEKLKWP